ncbi:MAG: dephospho-CoA kinase [Gammaproteobacteria bacterium]|nr:dephospho-CoA kinase [Gammaproteobacteria bacterium]
MLVIGLTGGIGCGKSAVTDLFSSLGVPVIDADVAAREVVAKGEPALDSLCQLFGSAILKTDGSLNRRQLRDIIFSDSEARQQVEAILHPRIRERMDARLAQLTTPYAIASIPLLLENGLERTVNRVLVVDCSPEEQIRRVSKRDRVETDAVEKIIASQIGREKRLAAADDVIVNSGSLNDLKTVVNSLDAKYIQLSQEHL